MRQMVKRQTRLLPWWFLAGLLFTAMLSTNTAADQPRLSHDEVGLLLFPAGAAGPVSAPALKTQVDIEVHGVVVRTRLTQRFENPGDDWVEGIYVFPLPVGAAVDRLRLRIGERLIEGEIQEKEQAEATYRKAREQGQTATLVSQQRPNIFTTAVANIAPNEAVEVEIAYQQRAQWRDDHFSLRFPMVVAPRYIPGVPRPPVARNGRGWSSDTDEVEDASRITPPVALAAPDGFRPLSLAVRLNLGLPLAEIVSPYHAIDTVEREPHHYLVELADGAVPAERDFVLRWRPASTAQPQAVLFHETWQDQHYAMLLLMPPAVEEIGEVTSVSVARELVLVMDTSGSMHGDSLVQAKTAVLRALEGLRPGDAFNVIQFNSSTSSLFPASRHATSTNLALARAYVRRLSADGGTEIRAALQQALDAPVDSGRLRQVVFLTDGAVGNEQAAFADIHARLGDSRLFTVGIGSAPNSYFMRRAARVGRGSYTFIGHSSEIESEVGRLLTRLRSPVLTDFNFVWSAAGAAVPVSLAYESLPDLYAGEPLVIMARSAVAPTEVSVRARLANRPWTHGVSLQRGADATGLHVLWARQRVAAWLDARVDGIDEAVIRQRVVDLGLAHHLVTPYTSLVAVDKTPRRSAEAALRRHDLAVRLPAGWSAQKVFGQLPMTATPAPLLALLGALAALAALGLWWQGRVSWRPGAS
jgi:Ca-activated chloride channel family protein